MKLATAIDVGTQDQQFKDLLRRNNIDADTCRQVVCRIANVVEDRVFIEIFLDYGDVGPSSRDVRIRLFYARSSRAWVFDTVDVR